MRFSLQFKALLPVISVLIIGVLLLVWIEFSMETPERQSVLAVAAAGAVVVCAVLLAVLAVLYQRPLVELQEKLARLRQGDLNVTVSFAGRQDEIGDLGNNFNDAVRRLRESRIEIEHLYQTQMSRAEHLATLGEMAAGLAHEIKNPLAGIAGVIEIIGRDLPAGSPSREVLADVQNEVLRIKRILGDLLDYARPRPPEIRPGNLNDTIEHAVALARVQAQSRPVEIRFEPASKLAPVAHDSSQMQQVLLNLLLNSLQAVDSAGRVVVRADVKDEFVVVSVRDTGRGIAPEHLASIFRPFFTTKGRGTGLGLSLARRIVESHGGRIEVQSKVGEGTEIRVWLPLEGPPAGPHPAAETAVAKQ